MRRYAVPLLIASLLIAVIAIATGRGLRLFHESFPIWYHDLEVRRSTEAPPPLGTPSEAEMEECAAWQITSGEPANRPYFAETLFDVPSEKHSRDWYSNVLCRLGEPALSTPSEGDSRYRLLWMRAFHPPVVIRIESTEGLVSAFSAQMAGGEPNSPELRVERRIATPELAQIRNELNAANFWALPTSKHVWGLDGSRWVLEASEPDRYHVVSRFVGDEIKEAGRLMIDLSGLNPKAIY